MKSLIAIVVALFGVSTAYAGAASYKLPKGALALKAIKESSITFEPLCPKNVTCITDGKVVNLHYTLGCLNTMVPVQFKTEIDFKANKAVIYVTAFEVLTKASQTAKCFRAPIGTASIPLVGFFGEVEVRNTEYEAEVEIH